MLSGPRAPCAGAAQTCGSAAERNNRIVGAVGAAIPAAACSSRARQTRPGRRGVVNGASVHAPEQYEALTERAETAWQGLSCAWRPHLGRASSDERGRPRERGWRVWRRGYVSRAAVPCAGSQAVAWRAYQARSARRLRLILRRQTAARIGVESAIEARGERRGRWRARMARIGQPLPETNRRAMQNKAA